MPSAVFSIMIARHYGGHAPTAVQCVIATTLVSIITTPFVITWAAKAIGV
jgi:predicted permease